MSWQSQGDNGHYIVVTSCDGDTVHYQDPVSGPSSMPAADFLAVWHDADGDGNKYRQYGVAVRGPKTESKKDASGRCHDAKGHWVGCGEPGALKPDGSKANESSGSSLTDAFHKSIDGNTNLSNEQKSHYKESISSVVSRIPDKAMARIGDHVQSTSFYADTKELTAELISRNPKIKEKVGDKHHAGGAYGSRDGSLHLDGGTKMEGKELSTQGVYAHELSHAIDGPKKEISGSKAWQEAAESELRDGSLSKYAGTSSAEGFAEFGRAVYSGEVDLKQLETDYPKCAAVWKDHGIWPEEKMPVDDTTPSSPERKASKSKAQSNRDSKSGKVRMGDIFDLPAVGKAATELGDLFLDYVRMVQPQGQGRYRRR